MKNPLSKPLLALNTATHREEVAVIAMEQEPLKNHVIQGKVLAQSHWQSQRNESSKLLNAIDSVLKKAEIDFKDIGGVLAVTGPGPFSAVRIGCAVANALAFALNVPTFALTTEAFWRLRTSSNAEQNTRAHLPPLVRGKTISSPPAPLEILISAGKGHFALLNLNEAAFDPAATMSNHSIYSLEEIYEQLAARAHGKQRSLVCDVAPLEAELIKKRAPSTWTVLTEQDTKLVLPLGTALLNLTETLRYTPEGNILIPRYLRPPTITPSKKRMYV